MNDFEKLILTEQEQKVFNKFNKVNSTDLTEIEYNLLKCKGLVDDEQLHNYIDHTYTARLSGNGRDFRAYQKLCQKKRFKDELRYWITTLIALGSLSLLMLSVYK